MLKRIWIFDFDGTLAPIVPKRDKAELHPGCRSMLRELSALPDQATAVLSNRSLEDLIPRVDVPGIFVGANSGIRWRSPSGEVIDPEPDLANSLMRARDLTLPELHELAAMPGIELEDKNWSLAIHTRKANPATRERLSASLGAWAWRHHLAVHRGPEAYEVPLLPDVGKKWGVLRLHRILGVNEGPVDLFFAGDDGSDIQALEWISSLGGTAVSVGDHPLVKGSQAVPDQQSLCRHVGRLASLPDGVTATGKTGFAS